MRVVMIIHGAFIGDHEHDDETLRLTAKGRRLFERLWRTSQPIRTQLLAGFSDHEAEALLGFLNRLIQNAALIGEGGLGPENRILTAHDTTPHT
jgi:hypothetical protein